MKPLFSYEVPPTDDVTLEEFETWAVDRLRGSNFYPRRSPHLMALVHNLPRYTLLHSSLTSRYSPTTDYDRITHLSSPRRN